MILIDFPPGWYDKKKDSYTPHFSILKQYSDRELIDELKTRGYVVPKKEYVITLNTQSMVNGYIYEYIKENGYKEEYIDKQHAYQLANELLRPGILSRYNEKLSPRDGYPPTINRVYQTSLMVIIDDPEKYNEHKQDGSRSRQDEVSGES